MDYMKNNQILDFLDHVEATQQERLIALEDPSMIKRMGKKNYMEEMDASTSWLECIRFLKRYYLIYYVPKQGCRWRFWTKK